VACSSIFQTCSKLDFIHFLKMAMYVKQYVVKQYVDFFVFDFLNIVYEQ